MNLQFFFLKSVQQIHVFGVRGGIAIPFQPATLKGSRLLKNNSKEVKIALIPIYK